MQAYESAFKPGETRFLISPRSDFFRFFSAPAGNAALSADQPEPERAQKK
jgi:membrane protease subunit HflC